LQQKVAFENQKRCIIKLMQISPHYTCFNIFFCHVGSYPNPNLSKKSCRNLPIDQAVMCCKRLPSP